MLSNKLLALGMIYYFLQISITLGVNIHFKQTSCDIPIDIAWGICLLNNTHASLDHGHIDVNITYDGSASSITPIIYDDWRHDEYIVIYLANNFFNTYYSGNTITPRAIYFSHLNFRFGWWQYSPHYLEIPILAISKENNYFKFKYQKNYDLPSSINKEDNQ